MQIKFLLVLSTGLIISQQAWAVCTLDNGFAPDSGKKYGLPTTLEIPSQLIKIDADAPIGTVIATLKSTQQTEIVSYKECLQGENYGKSILPPLFPKGLGVRTYNTKIRGISITPMWSNGTSRSYFESSFPMGQDALTTPQAATLYWS